jgi:small subunit ribosomal protein S21
MQVFVKDNDISHALRVLKKKLQREGVFREMKLRRAYEKPSDERRGKRPKARVGVGKRYASAWSARATSLPNCVSDRIGVTAIR